MSIDLKTFVNGCSSRCIDDPQEIGKIISQMLQIKGRDFDEDEKLNLDHMSYYALNECSDKRYMTGDERNLTFGEILRFLNNFAVGEELPEKETMWRIAEVKASLLECMTALLNSRPHNSVINLYTAISVKGYFEHIEAQAGYTSESPGFFAEFGNRFDLVLPKDISDLMTIGDFFCLTMNTLRTGWKINHSLTDYQMRIMCCYNALYSFFIEYFMKGYSEVFANIN